MNDQIHIHLALKQIHDVINVKSYKIKLDVRVFKVGVSLGGELFFLL